MNQVYFSIAKYIADRRRMEPKNIGVIAWDNGEVLGRFAGEKSGSLKPPSFIAKDARDAYRAIVESWRIQLKKDSLPRGRGKDDALRTSPEFMETLVNYSQENFVIVFSGHYSGIPSGGLANVLDQLFVDMVEDESTSENRKKSALVTTCEELLSPLQHDNRFHRDLSIPCTTIEREFPFSYAFGEVAHPDVLIQTVSLANDDQVDSAAMKFRCVVSDERLIAKSQCASLVDDSAGGKKIRDRIAYLGKYCEPVSVANQVTARVRLSDMGLPLPLSS